MAVGVKALASSPAGRSRFASFTIPQGPTSVHRRRDPCPRLLGTAPINLVAIGSDSPGPPESLEMERRKKGRNEKAIGCTIDECQEAKSEILDRRRSKMADCNLPLPCSSTTDSNQDALKI